MVTTPLWYYVGFRSQGNPMEGNTHSDSSNSSQAGTATLTAQSVFSLFIWQHILASVDVPALKAVSFVSKDLRKLASPEALTQLKIASQQRSKHRLKQNFYYDYFSTWKKWEGKPVEINYAALLHNKRKASYGELPEGIQDLLARLHEDKATLVSFLHATTTDPQAIASSASLLVSRDNSGYTVLHDWLNKSYVSLLDFCYQTLFTPHFKKRSDELAELAIICQQPRAELLRLAAELSDHKLHSWFYQAIDADNPGALDVWLAKTQLDSEAKQSKLVGGLHYAACGFPRCLEWFLNYPLAPILMPPMASLSMILKSLLRHTLLYLGRYSPAILRQRSYCWQQAQM
jgi:hypothetical protein